MGMLLFILGIVGVVVGLVVSIVGFVENDKKTGTIFLGVLAVGMVFLSICLPNPQYTLIPDVLYTNKYNNITYDKVVKITYNVRHYTQNWKAGYYLHQDAIVDVEIITDWEE